MTGVLVGEGCQRDGGGVPLAAAPSGLALVQLGASGGDHEERHVDGPFDQVIDKGQERRVRPVEVLEQQGERLGGRHAFEECPPSGEGLFLLNRLLVPRHADEGSEAAIQP